MFCVVERDARPPIFLPFYFFTLLLLNSLFTFLPFYSFTFKHCVRHLPSAAGGLTSDNFCQLPFQSPHNTKSEAVPLSCCTASLVWPGQSVTASTVPCCCPQPRLSKLSFLISPLSFHQRYRCPFRVVQGCCRDSVRRLSKRLRASRCHLL